MEYNQNQRQNINQNPYRPEGTPFPNPGLNFATLAMILGVGCLFTFFTVYVPIVMGSIAIIFAVLSKGYGKKMLLTAKLGMISAICSITILLSIIGVLCTFIITSDRTTLTNMGETLDTQIESQMGMPVEDIFGTSYRELMEQYADLLGK